MKRTLLLVLISLFCVSALIGCGGAETTKQQSTEPRGGRLPK